MHQVILSKAFVPHHERNLLRSPTAYRFRHYSAERGGLVWASGIGDVDPADEADVLAEQAVTFNAIADEGESDILGVYFRDATEPSNFFLRLSNSTPVETSTLS